MIWQQEIRFVLLSHSFAECYLIFEQVHFRFTDGGMGEMFVK